MILTNMMRRIKRATLRDTAEGVCGTEICGGQSFVRPATVPWRVLKTFYHRLNHRICSDST